MLKNEEHRGFFCNVPTVLSLGGLVGGYVEFLSSRGTVLASFSH
jgi:hypothetical protein